jgi:hypothetical protein
MPHRLKHLRVASDWADCEKLQYETPLINDDYLTDKQVVCIRIMRKIVSSRRHEVQLALATNGKIPALNWGHAFEADNITVLQQKA